MFYRCHHVVRSCYHASVIRTQIQLTEVQIQALRRLSIELRVSIADLVRRSVDMYLTTHPTMDRDERIERALGVVGQFSSGSSDGSTEHDTHLAEAFKA